MLCRCSKRLLCRRRARPIRHRSPRQGRHPFRSIMLMLPTVQDRASPRLCRSAGDVACAVSLLRVRAHRRIEELNVYLLLWATRSFPRPSLHRSPSSARGPDEELPCVVASVRNRPTSSLALSRCDTSVEKLVLVHLGEGCGVRPAGRIMGLKFGRRSRKMIVPHHCCHGNRGSGSWARCAARSSECSRMGVMPLPAAKATWCFAFTGSSAVWSCPSGP